MTEAMKKLFIITFAALVAFACQQEEIPGTLELAQEVIYLPAEADSMHVELAATSEWRLEFPSSTVWLSTDLHGGKANRRYFTVKFEANPYTSVRSCDIRVYTTDRNDEKTLRLIQKSKMHDISFSKSRMTLRQNAGLHSAVFRSSLKNEDITMITDSEWITLSEVAEGDTVLNFYVDRLPSVVEKQRLGYIFMSYVDDFERLVADTLLVRQIVSDPERAELIGFSQAKSVLDSVGVFEDNKMVEGYVTVCAKDENYGESLYDKGMTGYRYILEDDAHETFVFESENALNLSRGDKARIWLLELAQKTYDDGGFRYSVFSGAEDEHVVASEPGTFEPRKVSSLDEIRYQDVFTLVTLENVEIAPLYGAFTNFKESSPSAKATSQTHTIYYDYKGGRVNWMKSFPEYYRFYPTPLIDAHGNSMYMHVSPAVSWAHESYPQGKGSVTGLVVRESLSNFDITPADMAIRPLTRDDIALDTDRGNGLPATLVNFEFEANDVDNVASFDGVQKFIPKEYNADTDVPCTFMKAGATKIGGSYDGTVQLGFQDKFRGNVKVGNTDGNNCRAKGMVGQVPANTIGTFIVENLCTKGITSQMTMTVEVNSNKVTASNPIRAMVHYSLDGEAWTMVEDSEIKFLCQFDRDGNGEAANREPAHIPGMKIYSVKLPSEICDQESVFLKIEQVASKTFTKTVRFGSLTIKYNK